MKCGGTMKTKIRLAANVLSCSLLLLLLVPLAALCGSDLFTDSNDYKSKDFKEGILADYKDLKNGKDIDWAWIASGTKLGDYKVAIESFTDATDDVNKSQLNAIKDAFVKNVMPLAA